MAFIKMLLNDVSLVGKLIYMSGNVTNYAEQ